MKQTENKAKKQKKSLVKEKERSYDRNYKVISSEDSKQYKSDNLSVEIINYKL